LRFSSEAAAKVKFFLLLTNFLRKKVRKKFNLRFSAKGLQRYNSLLIPQNLSRNPTTLFSMKLAKS